VQRCIRSKLIITQGQLSLPSLRVGKWVPASAGKAKAGVVHSVNVQVKLWDSLRTRAIPEDSRGVFTTTRYTNPRLPLPTYPFRNFYLKLLANRQTDRHTNGRRTVIIMRIIQMCVLYSNFYGMLISCYWCWTLVCDAVDGASQCDPACPSGLQCNNRTRQCDGKYHRSLLLLPRVELCLSVCLSVCPGPDNTFYINSSHHQNRPVTISVPVAMASPALLYPRSSCAKTSWTVCYTMIYIKCEDLYISLTL